MAGVSRGTWRSKSNTITALGGLQQVVEEALLFADAQAFGVQGGEQGVESA